MQNRTADGRHAGTETQCPVSPFQCGDFPLGYIHGGVADPGVGVFRLGQAVDLGGLYEQGILKNMRYNGAAELLIIVPQMGADILRGFVRSWSFAIGYALQCGNNKPVFFPLAHSGQGMVPDTVDFVFVAGVVVSLENRLHLA